MGILAMAQNNLYQSRYMHRSMFELALWRKSVLKYWPEALGLDGIQKIWSKPEMIVPFSKPTCLRQTFYLLSDEEKARLSRLGLFGALLNLFITFMSNRMIWIYYSFWIRMDDGEPNYGRRRPIPKAMSDSMADKQPP